MFTRYVSTASSDSCCGACCGEISEGETIWVDLSGLEPEEVEDTEDWEDFLVGCCYPECPPLSPPPGR